MIGFRFQALLCLIALSYPAIAWSQAPAGASGGPSAPLTALRSIEKSVWHVYGRVTSLSGEPVSEATVQVNIGNGHAGLKTLQTDLQGNFSTEYELLVEQYKSLSVSVVASKSGYFDARETVDFGSSDKTWGIDLTLRDTSQDPDQLSQADLIARLAPRLQQLAATNLKSGSAAKDWDRAVHELLEQHDAARAVSLLRKVEQREPSCVECKLMLGLAELDAGGWNRAMREFSEAAKLAGGRESARSPEPLLVLGVLEDWQHQPKKAAGFFLQALAIDPNDPLVLQELGRALVVQQNWEAANEYLTQAIKAGAPAESHLLRAKALLNLGDLSEANAEMTSYLAGREAKQMPLPVRAFYAELQDRTRLEEYSNVKSVVTQPIAELTRALPELGELEVASTQDELPAILKVAGEGVRAFFEGFPNTISTEQIRQEMLRQDGHVKESLEQKYAYLLLARSQKEGRELGLEEYRTDSAGTLTHPHGLDGGFMLTTGFASTALVFHPAYQPGASFRFLGRQTVGGHKTFVVAFAQRPETARSVERFNVDDASELILVQGVAWVDCSTGHIIRMRTDLLKPASRVRLTRQTTQIQFDEVHFKDMVAGFWLPREVVVTVEWKGRTFRNVHQYSDFRLYNVQSEEKRKAARLASAAASPV
jgi:Flp pilus assembly protein TadD